MSDAIIRSSPAALPHRAEQREKAQPLTFSETNKKESLSLSRQSLSLYQTPQTPPIVLQLQTTIIYSNLVCQNYQNYPQNWEIPPEY